MKSVVKWDVKTAALPPSLRPFLFATHSHSERISTHSKIFALSVVLMLYSLHITGQEPVDSTNYSKYTEPDIMIVSDPDEVVIISNPAEFAKIFPVDTLYVYSSHSPAKAAIMSAVLPGLGQIYNRKYWKLPIVYLAVGISVERFLKFQNDYNRFRRAYIDIMDGDPYTNYFETLGFPSYISFEQQKQVITKGKDMFRGWRDWAIVAVVASYALNIIDANVDAHMMDFSLDDNISFNIQPCFLENSFNSKIIGLSLRFTF
jgi:hypothetical protein